MLKETDCMRKYFSIFKQQLQENIKKEVNLEREYNHVAYLPYKGVVKESSRRCECKDEGADVLSWHFIKQSMFYYQTLQIAIPVLCISTVNKSGYKEKRKSKLM